MERTILFRGKRPNSGKWIQGYLYQESGFSWILSERFKTPECSCEVIPETVGEFTGLTDKNSVKVFSDDLLKDGKEDVFRVYQIAGGFCVKSSVWKTDTKEWTRSDILIAASLTDAQMQSYISESCEVIGNIHDKHVL